MPRSVGILFHKAVETIILERLPDDLQISNHRILGFSVRQEIIKNGALGTEKGTDVFSISLFLQTKLSSDNLPMPTFGGSDALEVALPFQKSNLFFNCCRTQTYFLRKLHYGDFRVFLNP